MNSPDEHQGPLTKVRVIDCSTIFAAPLIAAYLADFGADVIKVEHPGGDPVRRFEPTADGVSLWSKLVNRNKRSITLDLHSPRGQDLFRQLVREADVVIANFRPGVLESWSIGYDDLVKVRPDIILLGVTAFGRTGPYSDRPGFGTLAEAMSGLANLLGYPDGPPLLPAFGLGDSIAALAGAFAIVLALFHRQATGRGQFIDLAIVESLLGILGLQLVVLEATGHVMRREGNRVLHIAPRGVWETSDGHWVAISITDNRTFECLANAIDQPSLVADSRFVDNHERVQHRSEIEAIVEKWFGSVTFAEAVDRLARASAPFAPVYDAAQIVKDPQYLSRKAFVRMPDDELGHVLMPNVLAHLTATPGSMRRAGRAIGADNSEIYRDLLGLRPEDIALLRESKVI